MRFQTAGNLLALGALAVWLPTITEAKTCLMLYQMADNNLEFYLRQDYEELTNSPVIDSPDLRTWIYYDALEGENLPNTVDASGTPVSGVYTGSRYLTYDTGLKSMKVDTELPGEQDSDQQSTVQDFLEHAMTDCLANGYDSLMAVFSSHGGGFAGYGGDENKRKLLQTNQGIAAAVTGALAKIPGSPPKLEVIGFDACLMQAVGAADDYKSVTDYILASEAVEPGHGWAYDYLTSAGTALELATQILETFISETQGTTAHRAPKTMAILNTQKFVTFITAFENLSAAMLKSLKVGDVSLHTFISRARAASIAFEGIVDIVGAQMPSGLDIGSFLENFRLLCNPTGTIGTDLGTAIAAYADMFEAVGVGTGTPEGTGMHITWPNQAEYDSNINLWDQVLFENESYATDIIPNFQEFLQYFLPSASPENTDGSSICVEGALPTTPVAAGSDDLILTDEGNLIDGGFKIDAELSESVSQVMIEYGIDLSTPLKPVLEAKGYVPADDEYLYLLGGDVMGTYSGSKFEANWDQNFYFLELTGVKQHEALYVFDQGDGSRRIPAMYFPQDQKEAVAKLQFLDFLFFDFDYWVDEGASFSFLKFSVDEAEGRVNNNLSLFTSTNSGTFSEMPRQAGGFLIPLIYIDAYIQGRQLTTLPGGFNQTIIEWKEDIDYTILTTPAENVFKEIPDADAVLINMYGYDHGERDRAPDVRYYDVIRPNKGGGNFSVGTGTTSGSGSSTPGGQIVGSGSSATSNRVSIGLGLAISLGLLVTGFI